MPRIDCATTFTNVIISLDITAGTEAGTSYTAPDGWAIISWGLKGNSLDSDNIILKTALIGGGQLFSVTAKNADTSDVTVRFQLLLMDNGATPVLPS